MEDAGLLIGQVVHTLIRQVVHTAVLPGAIRASMVDARPRLSVARHHPEHERELVASLQEALFGRPDTVDDLCVATVYLPADVDHGVGGDWVDVIRLGDGRIALVVGDVVGHSVGAATVMAQLRSAVRVLLGVCLTPADVLERLDAFAATVHRADSATMALVLLDPGDGRFAYVSAGHPPLALRRADRTVVLLEDGRNAPIGAGRRELVAVGTGVLEPGDLLALYTDGLVERRGECLDTGLARLGDRLVALDLPVSGPAGHDLTGPARWIVDSMLEGRDPDDDVCVLLATRTSDAALHRRFVAEARSLGVVRASLRAWGVRQGLSADHLDAVLVVAGEAMGNAVEHAYAGREPGVVTLDVSPALHGEVVVRVSDQGAWRRPSAAGVRGHGMRLMRALSSTLQVDRLPTGTTVRATVPSPGTPSS